MKHLKPEESRLYAFVESLLALGPQPQATPDEMWRGFKSDYFSIQARCIPQKRVGGSVKVNPKWFHDGLSREIRRRKLLYVAARTDPSVENERLLHDQRKYVKRLVRQAKVTEEHRVASASRDNPKEFFAYVNTHKASKKSIGPIRTSGGELVHTDPAIAEELNEYFVSVFTREELPHPSGTGVPDPVITYGGSRPLTNILCTIEEVCSKFDGLNPHKAGGPDGFLPKVMKNVKIGLASHSPTANFQFVTVCGSGPG